MAEVIIKCGEKHSVTLNTGLFIDGNFVLSESKKCFSSFNPANGEKICDVSEAAEADVNKAVAAATKAFSTWGRIPSRQRSEWMWKIVKGLQAHAEDFAYLEALDNGKTLSDAKSVDVPETIETFIFYASLADKLEGKTYETDVNDFSFTRREPIGVCGAIIPWNFPFMMLSWKAAPALACGNTMVLKSSEKTPLTALLFCKVCQEVGLPNGVFNLVSGFGPIAGVALAAHNDVLKIAFTGSVPTARAIMSLAAGSNLKKISLELGGKSPNIIFDDANLDLAVAYANGGIFFNQGQVCCAGSRIFVQEGIYDEFVKRFVQQSENIKLGDQFDEDTMQGPQIDDIQFKKILGYIECGKKEGCKVACGGEKVGTRGYFVSPTLLVDVKDEMTVSKEEIFGPVACLFKFKTEEEVVERANNTSFGLAAAIFTQDISRAFRVEKQLKAGTVWINCYGNTDVRIPFGGYKESGFGRELSKYALDMYTQIKAVRVAL